MMTEGDGSNETREEYAWARSVTDGSPGEPRNVVFVHIKRSPLDGDWLNVRRVFLRVPLVGEYVALNEASSLFRVDAVIHCPFDASVGAEIWCSPYDYTKMLESLRLDSSEASAE